MKRTALYLAVAALLVVCRNVSPAQGRGNPGAKKPEARLVGVMVTKPAYPPQEALRAFNENPGTQLSVLVTVPGGGLVALKKEKSKVIAFADDKGTDLLKVKSAFGIFGHWTKISEDRKACLFNVQSKLVPAAGARRLLLEARIVLSRAKGRGVHKQVGVKAKKGSRINAGPVSIEIYRVKKPREGKDPLRITLKIKGDGFESIRFLDSNGKEISSRKTNWSPVSNPSYIGYALKQKVEHFTVEVVHWKDIQEVIVPVRLRAGIGF